MIIYNKEKQFMLNTEHIVAAVGYTEAIILYTGTDLYKYYIKFTLDTGVQFDIHFDDEETMNDTIKQIAGKINEN